MSCRAPEQYRRYYAVSDPRSHPKGHTEYKVTAKFVSKANPEDVKEIVVWKRYSDFKKLHGDLGYIHRNLFRRLEDFPAFPKAQVFGRFDPQVIEERRQAAENMLRFTVQIPALNNSPQLKEFFRGGEGKSPPENSGLPSLPPPLIPVPPEGIEAGEDALGSLVEQGLLQAKQDPSRGAEALSPERHLEPKSGERAGAASPKQLDEDEALDVLFAFVGEEEDAREPGAPPCCLSVQELALFDPFSKEGAANASHGDELAALGAAGSGPAPSAPPEDGTAASDPGGYLPPAVERIRQAMASEAAGNHKQAFDGYRGGVDLLLQGLQGDPDPARREAVKKKTAEYLQRAEDIFRQHLTGRQSPAGHGTSPP
ncbi:sorting nexin-15 isoform X2 [Varanus komodoensis]|uniref:sorting nexin-15 isoform X2 n=1 Tax=Varanus komodoensis TaxID=61221 RepID=UPI001CF7A895|nr:sorting nexin-15 isoform X2 [Varanus komodoensis]